jgi:hypothetical protein
MKGAAMRFPAAAIKPKQPLRAAAAAELIRRIVPARALPPAEPAPLRNEDLPADLDQRVRLVGEW